MEGRDTDKLGKILGSTRQIAEGIISPRLDDHERQVEDFRLI